MGNTQSKINGYTLIRLIGDGQFGIVYEATRNKQKFAIKIIRMSEVLNKQFMIREVQNMKKSESQYTTHVYQYFFHEDFMPSVERSMCCWIVMELCDASLEVMFKKLSMNQRIKISYQIIKAVGSLHQHKICHRDIKLENILLNVNQQTKEIKIKLTDFGFSKQILSQKQMSSNVGTSWYKAPQLLKGEKYSEKVDAWAVGIVMLQLWLNCRVTKLADAFPGQVEGFPKETLLKAIDDLQLREITRGLLIRDPQNRGSVKQICEQLAKQQQKARIVKAAKAQSWASLTELTKLDISNKKLSQLPNEIGNLNQLQQLQLHNNNLRSLPLSIGKLANLKQLDCGDNKLVAIPECILQLKQLQKLWMHRNQITQIPPQIGQLKQLQVLAISNNPLTALPQELWRLHSLKYLWISSLQLSMLSQAIGRLTNLILLQMHGNKLIQLPQSFSKLKQLQWLSLTVVAESEISLEYPIDQLTSLQQLYLRIHVYISEYDKPKTQQQTRKFEAVCKYRKIKLQWSTG